MKIKTSDAFDRYKHLVSQEFDIGKTVQSMIDSRPFGNIPFYIYGHKREIGLDERMQMLNQDLTERYTNPNYKQKFQSLRDVPSHRLIWQPRLTRPKASINAMLFKGYPGTDLVKTCWMLPDVPKEEFQKGNITQNEFVLWCHDMFKNNRAALDHAEDDDLDDGSINMIYNQISMSANPQPFKMI